MYCENCGKEVPAQAKFCRYCGADTAVAADAASEEAVPSGGETPPGGKLGLSRSAAALFAAAVALAVLIAAGVFIFQRFEENRYIGIVRGISVSPEQKLGELVDEMLPDSQWDTALASDGEHYVNIRGTMSYIGVSVPVVIQYKVTSSGQARYHSTQIDGQVALNIDPVVLLAQGLDYLTEALNVVTDVFDAVTGNDEAARTCDANTRVLKGMVVMIAAAQGVPAECIDIDSEGILYLDGPEYYTQVGGITGDGPDSYIRAWPSCGGTPFVVDDGIVKNTCAHLRSADIDITRTYPDAPSLPNV
ncbi:MAG: zinc ribbon domain-containing protein [Gracilibacteraceae bacterium]|jgi:hypothetical protein|nr:zinc ribbon domain-containing protein [Gracilibacteraceae bacterium]